MECESRCRSRSHAQELNNAITKGAPEEVKCFIQRCHNFGKVSDGYGRNLLHMASSCGREDLLLWLLSTGKMDVNQKDKESGWTPLHRAIFYGHIGSAVALIRAGASLSIRDNEGLTSLDLAMKDLWQFPFIQLTKGGLVKHGNADVYTWGDNSNYTLGHRSEQNRNLPDIVEFFSKHETSIKEVVMTKYHSIFLSLDGRVFVCGHGRGGRLGLGHEEAAFQPMKVSSLGTKCIAVAAGRDHSLLLMEGGAVYGCGLTEYYQLGDQADGSKKLLLPKPVAIKSLKGKHACEQVVGICAGRYHSVFYTATSLFTVGLNAGQLGHLKSDAHDPCQKQPRVVSAIHQHGSSIKQVCSSDAAIAVLMTTGEIYVLHEYLCRKVTKYAGCVQLAVCGGHLDHRLDPGVLCERGGSELLVCALGATGQVFIWRETWQSFARLDWCIGRQITVTDMALSLFDLLVCTSEGEAFRVTISNVKRDRIVDDKWDHFTTASARTVTGAAAAAALAGASDTIGRRAADARARRIAGIHRAIAVALDHKSTRFSVLQAQPAIENSFVMIPESSFVQDFESLLETADIYDGLADVHLQVDSEVVPSHAYVLACRSEHFRSLVCASDETSVPLVLPLPSVDIDADVLRHVLRFLYGGRLDVAAAAAAVVTEKPAADGHRAKLPIEAKLEADTSWPGDGIASAQDGSSSSQCNLSEASPVAEPGPAGRRQHGRGGAGTSSHNRGFTKGKVMTGGGDRGGCSTAAAAGERGLGALKDVARSLKVKELLDRVSSVVPHRGGFMVTKTVPQRLPAYRRSCLPQLHDIVLVSLDGQEVQCHKCVLCARLEYFRTMLSTVWIHGSTDCGDGDRPARLDLPVPADVLRAVVDYLYTDDLALADGSRSPSAVDFLCNVLVVADQWLLTRLKSICEARLVSQLTQKSVWPLLTFALMYNASSLAESCQEFVSLNLACTLETLAQDGRGTAASSSAASRGDGDEDQSAEAALRSVSAYYRCHLPCMARRLITPYVHDNPSAAELARSYADSLGGAASGSSQPQLSGSAMAPCGSGGSEPLQSGSSSRSSKVRRRDRLVSASSSGCSASDVDLSISPALATATGAAVPASTAAAAVMLPLSPSAAVLGLVSVQCPTSGDEAAKRPEAAAASSAVAAVAAKVLRSLPASRSLAVPSSPEAARLDDQPGAASASLREIMHAEQAAAAAASVAAADRILSAKAAKLSQREKRKLAALLTSEGGSKLTHRTDIAATSASVAGAPGSGRTGKGSQQQQQAQTVQNAWGTPKSAPVVSLRDVMTGQTQVSTPRAGKPALRAPPGILGPPPAPLRPHPTAGLAPPTTAASAQQSAKVATTTQHALTRPTASNRPVVAVGDVAVVATAWSTPSPSLAARVQGSGGGSAGGAMLSEDNHGGQRPETGPRLASHAFAPPTVPFQLIVDAELKRSENEMKLAKKPLALIQIEELAIAELHSHYRALASCDGERLSVERLSAACATGNSGACAVPHSWAAHASPQK